MNNLKKTNLKNTSTTNRGLSRVRSTLKTTSVMGLQLLLVVGVIGLLAVNKEDKASDAPVTRSEVVYSKPATLDEISAADFASRVARTADIIVADNVGNHADSLEAKVNFTSEETTTLDKPQIVSTELKTVDDIQEYTVKEGEDVKEVAKRFNVSEDTIKWENGLYSNSVGVGKKLRILPVDGVSHKVKEGDTVESITKKYDGKEDQVVAFNDLEVTKIDKKVGKYVIIPDGVKPDVQAPQVTTLSSSGSAASAGNSNTSAPANYSFGTEPIYGGNGYSHGYCTWHAANRRAQIGKPIPRNLGNAVTWASLAASAGLGVDGTPQAGDVLWDKRTYLAGGLGHVAFVENVNEDGSILVSDMNYPSWGVMTTRVVPKKEVSGFLFIH